MSFDDTDKLMGAGYFSLADDGDMGTVIIVGEPMPRKSQFRGKARVQACFPVFHDGQLKVWTMGNRLYTTIKDNWDTLYRKSVRVTRHGKKGSQDTEYKLKAMALATGQKTQLKALTDKIILEVLQQATTENMPDTVTRDDVPF